MNERIKELAIEAGYKHPDAVGMCEDYAYFDHEKFAELIIRECATICDESGRESRKEQKYGPHDDGRPWDGAWQCESEILKRFGVEE